MKSGKQRTSPFVLYGGIAIVLTAAVMIFLFIQLGWNIIIAYLVSINLSTFLFYGYDKTIAGTSMLRVPEWILHGLAIGGGSPAGLASQKLFRHKTIKASFQKVYWAIVMLQIVVLVFLGVG